MKKLLLMLVLSVSIFANWKVDNNTAYVKSKEGLFKYYKEGNMVLSSFVLDIPANKHVQEVIEANKKNMYIYIADSKNLDDGISVGGAKDGVNVNDFYNLATWRITSTGIQGTIYQSSPFFKGIDKILKQSSSILVEVYLYDEANDNSETFYELSFSSAGYSKAKGTVDKNAK